MHVLSNVGTVLRIDADSGQLIHAPLWPVRPVATDWVVQVPRGGVTERWLSIADPLVALVPGATPSQVHFERGGQFLCASPVDGAVRYNRPHAAQWETFRLVTPAALRALRVILGTLWTAEDGAALPPLQLDESLILNVGGAAIDLMFHLPQLAEDGGSFSLPGGTARFNRAAGRAEKRWVEVSRRRRVEHVPRDVLSEADLHATPDSRLVLQGPPEFNHLPITVSRADEDWLLEKWNQPGPRRLGRQHNFCRVVREQDKYVLMIRGREGLIFDEGGAANEIGYLFGVNIGKPGELSREGDHVYIDTDRLDAAPHLAGPHAVFYGGNLANYYHWVIDALLPLHVLAPLLPPGTRLLIPGTLRGFREGPAAATMVDHMAALRAWGFGDLPQIEIDAPVCHVDEVYWLDDAVIEHMPAGFVTAARAAVLARLGPPQDAARSRIFMRRRGARRVHNAAPIERIAEHNGFTCHEMEGMTPEAQMALFRDAEFVIAPHGAGMTNLLFCPPGTKVIEFSPDCEFRPLFAQISDKVGLSHAVLPCPTHDGGFNGNMIVDVEKFRALLRMMMLRE